MSRATTIQLTHKWIKATKALGWLAIFLALWLLFNHQEIGGLIFWGGVLAVIVARAARWWENE